MSQHDPGSGMPPPGWYPDPERPGNRRWWDGSAWSEFSEPVGEAPQGGPGVQPAAGGYGMPAAQPAGQPPQIDVWLWQSIVVTILCCLPLGVVGIVFASQANTEMGVGNWAAAEEKAKQAKTFTIIGFALGLAAYLVGFGIFFLPFMVL